MNVAELRRRVGAILAAEELRQTDWNEVDRLIANLRQHLAAEPETQCPKIVERFLAERDVRENSEPYGALQRERVRRFVNGTALPWRLPVSWWGAAVAMAALCGFIFWVLAWGH